MKNRISKLIKDYQSQYVPADKKAKKTIAQHEIASLAGIDPATLSRYKNEVVTRSERIVIERLCEFFDVDVSDILYLDKEDG